MASASSLSTPSFRLFDIGLNLVDSMYQGIYRNKKRHDEDIAIVSLTIMTQHNNLLFASIVLSLFLSSRYYNAELIMVSMLIF